MSKASENESFVVPPRITPAALALWAQAEARKVATDLGGIGIPVMMLKGPDLQMRLYGTPAAYASGDVDVLVTRAHAERARGRLVEQGWTFSTDNGVLWRLSGAAAFARDGFTLDLHWGLHAAHLPAWTLQRLERRLWERAARGPSGMLEPDAESLMVYLAVHVVGHRFERPQWQENVKRAADLVSDWERVQVIAQEARVEGAVQRALAAREPDPANPTSRRRVGSGGRGAQLDRPWALPGERYSRCHQRGVRSAAAGIRDPGLVRDHHGEVWGKGLRCAERCLPHPGDLRTARRVGAPVARRKGHSARGGGGSRERWDRDLHRCRATRREGLRGRYLAPRCVVGEAQRQPTRHPERAVPSRQPSGTA